MIKVITDDFDYPAVYSYLCDSILVEIIDEDGIDLMIRAKYMNNEENECISILSKLELKEYRKDEVVDFLRKEYIPMLLSSDVVNLVNIKERILKSIDKYRVWKNIYI